MKPCRKYRKDIVWLAIDALDAARSAELRAHLQRCHGCRDYFEEIAHVKETLTATASAPEIKASQSLHRGVLSTLNTEPLNASSTSVLPDFRALCLSWRVAVPAMCALAMTILVIATLMRPSDKRSPAPAQSSSLQTQQVHTDVLPTLANYHALASQSLERFDDLLTQQARKPLPAAPSFSAATLALLNVPD